LSLWTTGVGVKFTGSSKLELSLQAGNVGAPPAMMSRQTAAMLSRSETDSWRQMDIDEPDAADWSLPTNIAAGRTLGGITVAATAPDLDAVLPRCVRNGWIAEFNLRVV